ncbi:BOP1NT-domain-containing protein [Teratosphaeria nubilosa]|uniref:Ribosome biogenesis protein ERB1 n=1 Tax=Teratosphaeria nubilosa TaxID=161662 RepID=A0A6G1KVG3_9PEZI|nr:BOP1NT-domain-containing protein [Teratosphaeria nubilosa]
MAQRAGQKRKVVEVPRPRPRPEAEESEVEEEELLNGDVSDEGDSEEDMSDDEELEDDDDDDDEELDSDEIPSSEDEEAEDVTSKSKSKSNGTTTPMDRHHDQPNYTVETDANGHARYIYRDIDPVYDSDDSDAPATAPANTIGNIPLSYYDAYPHIGYDINGKRIARPAQGEALDSLLDSIDLPEGWTGLTDPATGKPLQLSKDELDVLKKLTRNEAPGDGYDPYPDYVAWFTGEHRTEIMPLSAAPEPKRRFVPSSHEHKRVMKMVKAIKDGRIKPYSERTEEDEEREAAEDYATYDVWAHEEPRGEYSTHIPAPKLPPPGYEESYHPPPEYLPDKDERKAWEEQDEEDRDRDFLPQDHAALRKVPGYARLIKEKFERCLDLYLAPRVRKSKLNIDPESLLPKLPDPSELKPFPTTCATVCRGHEGRVRSLAFDPSGKYVASGGDDGTVRIWEFVTGRQLWRIKLSSDEAVNVVSWRPGQQDVCILAAACGETVYFMIPGSEICTPEVVVKSREVLDLGFGYAASKPAAAKTANGADKPSTAIWTRPSTSLQDRGVLLTLTLTYPPKTLTFHRRGDYLSTVSPTTTATSTAVAIHTLSKHLTQHPFKRLKGLAQTACFHPSKPLFVLATRQRIRIYDLQQQKLEKELQPGARWISSISLHPQGSNLLVSSYDKRLLWHDLDLGATPYKTLRYHRKAIRDVAFHPTLPLFADASDDGTLQVFHGKVVGDSLENATVVPLKVLGDGSGKGKGGSHRVVRELGVLAVQWHPQEAWCVSAGADGTVRVWM